jgi:hypothetical protein
MVHKVIFTPREELKIEAYITPIIKNNPDITFEEIASKLDDELVTLFAKGMLIEREILREERKKAKMNA